MIDNLEMPGSSGVANGFSSLLQNQTDKVGVECVDFETDNPHDQDTLGFRLSGSRSAGVFIKSIHGGSPADLVGKIHAGDQLLQVDEIRLSGMTPDQVVRILRAALSFSGRVKVTVAHPWAERSKLRPSSTMSPSRSDCHLARKSVQSPTISTKPPLSLNRKMSIHQVEVHRKNSSRSSAKVSPEYFVNRVSPESDSTATVICDADDNNSLFSMTTPLANNIASFAQTNIVFDKSTNWKTSDKTRFRAWDSEDNSLNVPKYDDEDNFNVPISKPTHNEVKQMINPRKSFRKQASIEELPLVPFDQLNQTTPSPTTDAKRVDSSQSKSSKSSDNSNRSSQSQQLSWHCPVCLDGASRIRRTKRRMMSTVCGHVFCSRCVEDVVNKYRMCPTCRSCVSGLSEVHPIFM